MSKSFNLEKREMLILSFFISYDYYFGDLCDIGDALLGLERYEEALTVYEQAFQLASNSTSSYDSKRTRALSNKGYTLFLLDRYEEALVICDQVIQLTPKDFFALSDKKATF